MADYDLKEVPEIEEVYSEVKFEALKAIAEMISETSSKLIITELELALSNKDVVVNIKNHIMPYLYAAGFLSFAGREITESSISDVLKAIDLEPNPVLSRILINAGMKSHLVYIYSFYFLVANGREPSEENILRMVKAIGMPLDHERVVDILKFTSLPTNP